MTSELVAYCAAERVPGAVVVAFSSNGVTDVACHGVLGAENSAPAGLDTMFRIYSLAKLLTACAVVQLARRGLVDLDVSLGNYVEGLTRRAGRHAEIGSARQALSHSAGLVPDALTWAPLSRNDADLASDVTADYARAFGFAAPGRHYGYCNASFNLSALLIERVTGLPFARAIGELLIQPLGLLSTTYDPALAMTYPLAQPHAVVGGRLKVIHRPLAGSKWLAGSQCYSTPRDMAAFGASLLRDLRTNNNAGSNHHRSADSSNARIDQPVSDLRLDIGTRYGLGCYLGTSATGGRTVGHEGFFDGMWVKLVIEPDADRGLVWMDNRGDKLRDARYDVMRTILPDVLPTEPHRPAHGVSAGAAPPEVVGVYRRVGAPDLDVQAMGNSLVLTLDGRRRTLAPFGGGIWRAPVTPPDTGAWRPHAGSTHVCLGTTPADPDGTRVVHLNAIPYSLSR